MFGFGKQKFAGSRRQDLAYLRGFLINQPLPSKLAWYAQKLPLPLLQGAVCFMFVVEIPAPWLALWPGIPSECCAVLVGLHWLLAALAYRISWIGPLVKGDPVLLIDEGELQRDAMRESGITRMDLEQALRMEGVEPSFSEVQRAYLERDGSISVVPKESEPRVLDVAVQDGVQTVRIMVE